MLSDRLVIPQKWPPNDLVMVGTKGATASLARDYRDGREPMPKPGDFVIMLDGEGRPQFIWRTTEIKIKPLSAVDEVIDQGVRKHP